MRRIALSSLFVLLVISTAFSNPPSPSSPEDTVRQFYTWYLHGLNKQVPNPLKNRTVSLKYLTPEFLRRAPRLAKETDADAIICAQDFDEEWEKNVKVDAATINGSRATTFVQLHGPQMDSLKLKITLKKTTAGWRIDAVDCGQ